jgi:hypothetical protein
VFERLFGQGDGAGIGPSPAVLRVSQLRDGSAQAAMHRNPRHGWRPHWYIKKIWRL